MAWLPDGEKKLEDIFIRFGATHERDRQTDRHRMPAIAALCIPSHGNERIEYKLLSLTYKILTTSQATYLHNLVSLQSPRGTLSSSIDTLSQYNCCLPATTDCRRFCCFVFLFYSFFLSF